MVFLQVENTEVTRHVKTTGRSHPDADPFGLLLIEQGEAWPLLLAQYEHDQTRAGRPVAFGGDEPHNDASHAAAASMRRVMMTAELTHHMQTA